jgi:hypothetical protein
MRLRLALAALALTTFAGAPLARAADGFDLVVLGALGGIQDGNLSASMIHPHGDSRAVTCEAGTLVNGLRVAEEKGALANVTVPAGTDLSRVGYVLTNLIKGYLISHAHLDHVAGLIVASPDDGKKPVYVLPSVGADLVDTYFNWRAWPNFTDRGKAPQLKKYAIVELTPGVATPIADTAMTVTAYPLSHGGVESTAFLIESGGDGHPPARRLDGGGRAGEAEKAEGDRDRIVLHQRPSRQPAVRPHDAALRAGGAARARQAGWRRRRQGPARGGQPHQVLADRGAAAAADAAGAGGRQRPRRALRGARAGHAVALQVGLRHDAGCSRPAPGID